MKKIILVTCTILFASCMTEQKAVGWLETHGKLPEVCAKAFPSRDSVGELFYPEPAEGTTRHVNIDYTGDLSTLEHRGDSLLILLEEKQKQAALVSNECASVVNSFIQQVDSLQRIIKNLRSNYKPPQSDTVQAVLPHYNLNPPELAACQNKLTSETSRADKAIAQRDVYKQLFRASAAILVLIMIVFSLFLFSKFIKK